jgi:hypothetical protein
MVVTWEVPFTYTASEATDDGIGSPDETAAERGVTVVLVKEVLAEAVGTRVAEL